MFLWYWVTWVAQNEEPVNKLLWLLLQASKVLFLALSVTLWLPYGIGQAIIFLPCGFFLLLSFFPCLIPPAADWMSTILPHMVWPWCEFRMQV